MKFVYQLSEKDGSWLAVHTGSDIGPVRVTASTRQDALRKLEAEIRYWLEMCPCSGQSCQRIEVELVEAGPSESGRVVGKTH